MSVNVLGGPLQFDATVDMSQFGAQLSRIEAQLQGVTQSARDQATEIDNFSRKAATAIGTYLSVTQASNFVVDIARVRGEFQQLEVAFTTMLQSKEKADKLMAQVTQFAATTPFELQDVAGATKQLLAFGIGAEDIIPTMRSLGDVSSGIGAPLGEIAYLFGTIKTQGVAMTQDVRQFAQRGIPIYEELAKILGVTTEEVGDFITAGKVGFPQIQQVFQNLTAEGSKFGGLMAEQAKTLTGQISNFQDAYNQMLNDIGKSSEGAFGTAIKGATFLVEHYQDVLDIIKVLVITYGSYRAAIIAYNAVQAISASLTRGYTIAETLRYQAMLISEKAMKLLNRTMLSNPAVAIATGVALLVSALVVFNRTASTAAKVQASLNDVNLEAQKTITQEKQKLEDLLTVAKDETQSRERRETAMRKINEIYPETLGNLTLEKLATVEGKKAIDDYIATLDKKARAQAANAALTKLYEDRLQKEFERNDGKNNLGIQDKITVGLANLFGGKEAGNAFKTGLGGAEAQGDLDLIDEKIKAIQDTYKEDLTQQLLGEDQKQAAKKRTVAIIDEEIKAEKEKQSKQSTSSKEFQGFQDKINALEEERKKIVGASKSDIKSAQAEENKLNGLLNERKDILQTIADLQRDAKQSGLTKEQSELDKINEKYDQAIIKIGKFNQKVTEFNKKNKTNVQQVGIADINEARNTELKNADIKQDVENFKKGLDAQKAMFTQYEEAKKQIGIDKANEMFEGQTLGAISYIEFLKGKLGALEFKQKLGIASEADTQKMTALAKAINDEEKKNEEELFKQRVADVQRLFAETATVNQRKLAIEAQYEKDLATLRKEFSGKDLEVQEANLKAKKEVELQELQNSLITQSGLYRKLNQDIIGFSRERIKKEIKELKASLTKGTFTNKDGKEQVISPEFRKQLEEAIKKLQEFYNSTNKVFGLSVDQLNEIAGKASEVAGLFSQMSEAVTPLNKGLGDTFSQLSEAAGIAGSAASGLASFASGDYLSAAKSGMDVVTKIIGIFSNAKKSRKEAEQQLLDFQKRILDGEMSINEQYRERERQQAKTNKLRLQGLQDEKKVLEEQKKAVNEQYQAILNKLQGEQFISGLSTKKKKSLTLAATGLAGGIASLFGAGASTKVKQELDSLAGKSFEEIEKLFASGQLTDKAKELFGQLQKLKQEGADIDAMLEENKRRAQEIFTGTTSDSILDSITEGFKNGLHSAADFAGTFEDLMRGAIINSLKFKYLEGPLQEFFEQFAASSESDTTLSQSEIEALQNQFNSIIANADQQFQQLQQIAGINFGGAAGGTGNSLAGAIKGMSEQTAELLAGQLGGMRIAAIDQLNISKQALLVHQNIEINTALSAQKLVLLYDLFNQVTTGSKALKIQ